MFCPKCRAEYRVGITVCEDCNVPLVDKLPKERKVKKKSKEIRKKGEFKEIIITFNQGEIAFIKSLLDNAGIEYYFKGDYFHMVRPWADPVRLMVREDQVEEALKVLKDLDFGSVGWPRNEGKVNDRIDKGFCLNYWKLTYRRKFIRTLWITPLAFILFLFPQDLTFFGLHRNVLIICVFMTSAIQALYNYLRWKKEARKNL